MMPELCASLLQRNAKRKSINNFPFNFFIGYRMIKMACIIFPRLQTWLSCNAGSGLYGGGNKGWLSVSEIDPFIRNDCFDKNKVKCIIPFKYLSMLGKGLFLCNSEYFASKYFYLNAHNKKFQGYKFHRVAYCFSKQLKHWTGKVQAWIIDMENKSECDWQCAKI